MFLFSFSVSGYMYYLYRILPISGYFRRIKDQISVYAKTRPKTRRKNAIRAKTTQWAPPTSQNGETGLVMFLSTLAVSRAYLEPFNTRIWQYLRLIFRVNTIYFLPTFHISFWREHKPITWRLLLIFCTFLEEK